MGRGSHRPKKAQERRGRNERLVLGSASVEKPFGRTVDRADCLRQPVRERLQTFDRADCFSVAAPAGHLLGQQDAAVRHELALDEVDGLDTVRSEEHTSELQSLMRISYDVFCLKKT